MPGVSPVPAAETGWLQAGEGKSFSCSLCRKYLKNLKHIVTDKDTEKQIEKQVSKTVCPTMGDMEETCKLLVPIMVPKIMEATGNAILEKGCADAHCVHTIHLPAPPLSSDAWAVRKHTQVIHAQGQQLTQRPTRHSRRER